MIITGQQLNAAQPRMGMVPIDPALVPRAREWSMYLSQSHQFRWDLLSTLCIYLPGGNSIIWSAIVWVRTA